MRRLKPFDVLAKTAPVVVAAVAVLSFFELGPAHLWLVVSRPAVLLGLALIGALFTFLALVWRYSEFERRTTLEEEIVELRASFDAVGRIRELEVEANARALASEQALEQVEGELRGVREELASLRVERERLESEVTRLQLALNGQTMLRIPRDQVCTRLTRFRDELLAIGPDGKGLDQLSLAVHDYLAQAYTGNEAVGEFSRRGSCCPAGIQARVAAGDRALGLLIDHLGGVEELV